MSLIREMIKTWHGNTLSREKLAHLQQRRLKRLVRYAKKNSPYYESLYKNIGEDFRLEDLPPVSKPDLMANFDRVVTDRQISRKRVDVFCEDLDHVGKMLGRQTKITVDVNAPEEQIIRELNAFGPAMLSGYPSNLALLADNDELKIRPDVVITGGELLTPSVRKKLSDRFGCYVQTHYSCTEAGEIACECSEGHLHINEDSSFLPFHTFLMRKSQRSAPFPRVPVRSNFKPGRFP